MSRGARAGLTACLVIAIVALDSAGHAELFRCKGPDGKAIFTDQKRTCPGAEPSEPAGVLQRVPKPDGVARDANAPPSAIAAPAAPVPDQAVDAAAQWKQKKLDAEQKVEQIRTQREAMAKWVGFCNRPGGYIAARDEAGIQRVENCSELRQEFHSLEAQEAAARDYLATGLAEECRRAGCLPGWLR
jgi:hypothetical protein